MDRGVSGLRACRRNREFRRRRSRTSDASNFASRDATTVPRRRAQVRLTVSCKASAVIDRRYNSESLLHRHQRSNWDLREEFARRFLRQSNATVGGWIIRHEPGVHSEVETTQAHEIRHLHMIDGGTMISLLVGNYEVACACGVTLASGRTLRAIYRHTVLNDSNPLQSERNFDVLFFKRTPTAEKNLRGTPVTSLRRNIQRRHFITLGQLVPFSTSRKQSAQVVFPAEARSQHQDRQTFVSFNVTAERFRREQRQKILITAR